MLPASHCPHPRPLTKPAPSDRFGFPLDPSSRLPQSVIWCTYAAGPPCPAPCPHAARRIGWAHFGVVLTYRSTIMLALHAATCKRVEVPPLSRCAHPVLTPAGTSALPPPRQPAAGRPACCRRRRPRRGRGRAPQAAAVGDRQGCCSGLGRGEGRGAARWVAQRQRRQRSGGGMQACAAPSHLCPPSLALT